MRISQLIASLALVLLLVGESAAQAPEGDDDAYLQLLRDELSRLDHKDLHFAVHASESNGARVTNGQLERRVFLVLKKWDMEPTIMSPTMPDLPEHYLSVEILEAGPASAIDLQFRRQASWMTPHGPVRNYATVYDGGGIYNNYSSSEVLDKIEEKLEEFLYDYIRANAVPE